MKRNAFLTAAVVALAVVSFQLLRRSKPAEPDRSGRSAAAGLPESAASATRAAGLNATPVSQGAGFALPPAQETLWNQTAAEPAFANFAEWTRRYEAAATPEA